ncbi:hypothetical protein NMG60_11007256 [Bertholletia excelsa]
MADIAMLVAEEYERRVKNSRKNGDGSQEIDIFSSFSVLTRKNDGSTRLESIFGEEKMEFLRRVVQPKSQIGVAAFDGFFSA